MTQGVEELAREIRRLLERRLFGEMVLHENERIAPEVRNRVSDRARSVCDVGGERRKVDLARMCKDRVEDRPYVRHVKPRKARHSRNARGTRNARRESGEEGVKASARGGCAGSGRRTLGEGLTKGGTNGFFSKEFAWQHGDGR